MLLHFGVQPYLVFDGAPLPAKAGEEEGRRQRRRDSLLQAKDALSRGDNFMAHKLFTRAVNVTPEMAGRVIHAVRQAFGGRVRIVVAPYEADAQIAYLCRSNLCCAAITEDSDLLAYGVPTVLAKLDGAGACLRVDLEHVFGKGEQPRSAGIKDPCKVNGKTVSLKDFDLGMFQVMCVLAGCDYLPSPAGYGIKRAYKLVKKYRRRDRVLRMLKLESIAKKALPTDYVDAFVRALCTYRHQTVFDPTSQTLVPLKPFDIPPEASQAMCPLLAPEDKSFLGPLEAPAAGPSDPLFRVRREKAAGRACPTTGRPFTFLPGLPLQGKAPDEGLPKAFQAFRAQGPDGKSSEEDAATTQEASTQDTASSSQGCAATAAAAAAMSISRGLQGHRQEKTWSRQRGNSGYNGRGQTRAGLKAPRNNTRMTQFLRPSSVGDGVAKAKAKPAPAKRGIKAFFGKKGAGAAGAAGKENTPVRMEAQGNASQAETGFEGDLEPLKSSGTGGTSQPVVQNDRPEESTAALKPLPGDGGESEASGKHPSAGKRQHSPFFPASLDAPKRKRVSALLQCKAPEAPQAFSFDLFRAPVKEKASRSPPESSPTRANRSEDMPDACSPVESVDSVEDVNYDALASGRLDVFETSNASKKPSAGEWPCERCTFLNGARKRKCAVCGSGKPATPRLPLRKGERRSARKRPTRTTPPMRMAKASTPSTVDSMASCLSVEGFDSGESSAVRPALTPEPYALSLSPPRSTGGIRA